jgi:hypothetical protein
MQHDSKRGTVFEEALNLNAKGALPMLTQEEPRRTLVDCIASVESYLR